MCEEAGQRYVFQGTDFNVQFLSQDAGEARLLFENP